MPALPHRILIISGNQVRWFEILVSGRLKRCSGINQNKNGRTRLVETGLVVPRASRYQNQIVPQAVTKQGRQVKGALFRGSTVEGTRWRQTMGNIRRRGRRKAAPTGGRNSRKRSGIHRNANLSAALGKAGVCYDLVRIL